MEVVNGRLSAAEAPPERMERAARVAQAPARQKRGQVTADERLHGSFLPARFDLGIEYIMTLLMSNIWEGHRAGELERVKGIEPSS